MFFLNGEMKRVKESTMIYFN